MHVLPWDFPIHSSSTDSPCPVCPTAARRAVGSCPPALGFELVRRCAECGRVWRPFANGGPPWPLGMVVPYVSNVPPARSPFRMELTNDGRWAAGWEYGHLVGHPYEFFRREREAHAWTMSKLRAWLTANVTFDAGVPPLPEA